MELPIWKRVREATATATAPELLRETEGGDDGTAEDRLGAACRECKGAGVSESGDTCAMCEGAGYPNMKESTHGPYWVYSDDPEWDQLREADHPNWILMQEAPRTFSGDVRKKYASSGVALPDGSFPIPDKDALSRAIRAIGRASDPAKAKAHIITRAKALGATAMLPDDWQSSKEASTDNFGDKKAPPFDQSKESEEVLARLDKLEGQVDLFRALREAKPMAMTPAFSTPTRIKTSGGQEGYAVILIREGKGNKEDDQWYTADAIKEMCESGIAEGMQAYANHPDLEEEELRPERDIKQMVGTYHDVKFVKEGTRARAEAIFVPLTLNDAHPQLGWVVTLAEAAASSKAPTPICGISLYGLSAGDDGERPDGSFGRMVSMIRPSSGDIVTSAGAGGGFIRQVMESARKAQLRKNDKKELTPMESLAYQTAVRETAKRVREADSDEAREEALKELAALESETIDPTTDLTVESLREAAPGLVKDIEDAAKAEDGETIESLRERNNKLEGALSKFTDAIDITSALREAGITDSVELRHYSYKVKELGLREADEIKSYVESEKAYEEQKTKQLREALAPQYEDSDIEGAGGRVPAFALPTDGGVEALRESGLPLVTSDAS